MAAHSHLRTDGDPLASGPVGSGRDGDDPRHPRLAAALLMVAVVLVLVAVSLVEAAGG
ncbi:MAG: hypothetical protein MUF83_20825 [Acidimicrobiales bacterium]|jgi:hypothetical protein|nr:hypothetical protein [Acidimicrobiales bacterium]